MSSNSYDFTGKTVIVTGGSSGIGRAVARRFGLAGATVIVADLSENPRDVGETAPTHESIRDAGGDATFVETDVSVPEQIETVVEGAREFGGVDVMVNNAGIYRGASLVDAEIETFDTLYRVNVRGVFLGCQAAAQEMLARDEPGCIVNTASISSEYAQPGHAMYDATKGAVMMLTRVAALELAGANIRVNAVAPGTVSTTIASNSERGDESAESNGGDTGDGCDEGDGFDPNRRIEKDTPLGRAAEPAEVAGSYLFLASDDASYITGHLLYVDGGRQIF